MNKFPVLETENLILSDLEEGDLPFVVEYLQEKIFSELTSNIPYPYSHEDAKFWLEMSRKAFGNGSGFTFAIRSKEERIMGAIGIHDRGDDKAELGYWLAVPFWNKGYVTEAALAVVEFGFKELGYNKIFATHFPHNPSSARIMQKIGMKQEAILKEHLKKGDEYFDIPLYSIFKKK